jgi:hypothetical protein
MNPLFSCPIKFSTGTLTFSSVTHALAALQQFISQTTIDDESKERTTRIGTTILDLSSREAGRIGRDHQD